MVRCARRRRRGRCWTAGGPRRSGAPRPLPLGALSKSLRAWGRIDPHLLLYAFLPILLFGDAMSVNTHLLWQKLPHVLILAGPGVVLGTFALAAFAYLPLRVLAGGVRQTVLRLLRGGGPKEALPPPPPAAVATQAS